MEASQGS